MEPQFWHERWQQDDIGFHQAEFNTLLQTYWPTLDLHGSGLVFVPLAGKSRDMLWLRQQGHSVLGVELSSLAIDRFFAEAGLDPKVTQRGPFRCSVADGITLLGGDFFDLTAGDVRDVVAVYDRAALIALPPDLRRQYAAHLGKILPAGTQSLLISIDYPAGEITGPPFAVPTAEVHALFDGAFDVTIVDTRDGLAASDHLRRRGVTRMDTTTYLLRRK